MIPQNNDYLNGSIKLISLLLRVSIRLLIVYYLAHCFLED